MRIRVATADLNQTPIAWEANKNNILGAIREARDQGAQLVLCPEMSTCGYGCEDQFLAASTSERSLKILAEIAPHTKEMIAVVGLPLRMNEKIYNVAAVLVDGSVAGFSAKRYLAGDGIHYEPRWFQRWPLGERASVSFNGKEIPIGDYIFVVGEVGLGFEICEDAWVKNRPGKRFAEEGATVLLNPSASHFAFAKFRRRQSLVTEASQKFDVAYLYANQLGNESGRILYDGGGIIAQNGKLIAHGRRFSFQDRIVTTADIEVTKVETSKPSHIEVPFKWKSSKYPLAPFKPDSWESGDSVKEEEFTRAVAMGLFDYARKSRSKGYVVSLSGGADSAAAAVLIDTMAKLAVQELGEEAFWTRFIGKPSGRVKDILTCIYQRTENSSAATLESAKAVAVSTSSDWHVFEIQPLVNSYVEMVGRVMRRQLDWSQDDFALQNVQARVRSPGVWMVANLKNQILLSTMNRSEASVGYSTMDGDSSGGLAPLAGIDKHFLRHLLRWMEEKGPTGLTSVAALSRVNALAPTAELRPTAAKQTDEADLMPYAVLDAIERLAIHQRMAPLAVWTQCRQLFPKEADKELGRWVERFFMLWCRNQWKRERFAPSFHLDDANVDPRSWCRFPILSGGFELELEELRRALR